MKLIPAGLFRKSLHVLSKAIEIETESTFRKETITPEFLDTLVHFSILDDGPRIARDFFAKHGIILVIAPHLKKTYLDGAAFITPDGRSIIGLTLRGTDSDNNIESEADSFAEAALLPEDFDLDLRERVSQLDVLRYASEHTLHPAIVAGRIQYRRNNYRIFSNLVGRGEVEVHARLDYSAGRR